MPTAALRPCTYPGCNTLVSGGRCDLHSTKEVERDPAIKKLYNSKQWQSIRIAQLSNYPWCAECMKEGRYTAATEVDHVDPHQGDPARFFAGPFQSMCTPCHSRKTANEVWHV
jgi:5-methylcytosine-specific restriction enzyme A